MGETTMIAGLKPYPAYKDSGLPWLSQIPAHWKVLRAKQVFYAIDVRSETGQEELLTVSANDGVMPRRQKNVTMFMAESYEGHKLCWPGDLVINSLWAWMFGLGFSRYYGIVSSAYGVYRPRTQYVPLWRYFDYLLRSKAYDWELCTRSKGIWLSRLQLTDESFFDIPIILPPADEAEKIARYLAHRDALTRRYIRAKRQLISLLNEQKQTIIHCVVTRGLDPNVRLKPSGVEWLGDIPEHWDVTSVRRIISTMTSGSRGWADFYSDDGDIFLQSGNLGRSMSLNLSFIQRVKPPLGSEGTRTRVLRDDVLICITGALTGNVALVDLDLPSAYVNQHVALARPKPEKVFPRFLAYTLHSEVGRVQFKNNEYGGTKQGLGLDDVKSVTLPLPPMQEQKTIASELDRHLEGFIAAVTRIELEVSLLREYRTRLIADVVTGKLDVREAVQDLPDEADEPEPLDKAEALADGEDPAADVTQEEGE